MNELEKLFTQKETENGDVSYNTTGSKLLDLLFMTAYYEKHLDEVKIGNTSKDKLFSMFIRDPRFGIGRRDLGRELMKQSNVSSENVVKAGRFDDLIFNPTDDNLSLLFKEIKKGNELAKKWAPRLTCKDRELAKALCRMWNISEKTYRRMIKTLTTEYKLSHNNIDDIDFSKVPSLAIIKYYKRFCKEERFLQYIEQVKKGNKKINIATTNIYDIYRNRENIDAQLFFDKLEKIEISCIPVLDTSGSMQDCNDSIGKATSIAHYLSKCSTYCNGKVLSFSSNPQLITMGLSRTKINANNWYYVEQKGFTRNNSQSNYINEINSLYTGDCSNTDFGAVMNILSGIKENAPDYIVVLSDMEFDRGSFMTKDKTMRLFKDKGFKTKIVWWNFNDRNKTAPELDEYGNIFISGYSPYMLKYLESGFDGNKFLNKLLEEYKKCVKIS